MKIPNTVLTYKEKQEILKKWDNRTVGIGEINYVEYLVLQKAKEVKDKPRKD